MGKRVAVILAGCGVYDGSEIHEAVLTLLHLSRAGAEVHCFAPDIDQWHVINHATGAVTDERRNVLVEAARIARGQIQPLSAASTEAFDALIIPGGFGAAKNLCDFAVNGAAMQVLPELLALAQAFHRAGKPIGLMCIAPTMATAIVGAGAQLTIGTDADTAQAIAQMGGEHIACQVDEICIDRANKLITTPAYMLAQSIAEADRGIGKLVAEVLHMAG